MLLAPGSVHERTAGRVSYEVATVRVPENSEVSPVNSLVAVAVIDCPTATFVASEKAKKPLPDPSTARPVFWPMKVLPSSVPWGLEKNWVV